MCLMECVLDNLFNNVLCYCYLMVEISLLLLGNKVILIVEDDGLGIVLENCEYIFEFFVCFDFSWGCLIGGCGLGLVIVYFIVLVMGGMVNCGISELGGVCFLFSWLLWYNIL